MKAGAWFYTLCVNDYKLVQRDSLLIWMIWLPVFYALVLRWAIPPLTVWLEPYVDLTLYYHLIVSYMCVMIPSLLYGSVIGFLLLDERDDQTLTALRVTPLPFPFYLFYRGAIPFILSIIMTVVMVEVTNLIQVAILPLFAIAIVVSLGAPITTLLMNVLCTNKVQGFALIKGYGGLLFLPVPAYFLPFGWQLLTGVIPIYWPMKAFWILSDNGSNFWLFLVVGTVYHIALLYALLKFFLKRIS